MSSIHEELIGGLGRNVYYRAKRLLVRKFLDQQDARVVVGEDEYPLHDVSMNGMSFFAPTNGRDWQPGQTLEVQVALQDRPARRLGDDDSEGLNREIVFHGRALVARADVNSSSTHVGLQLEGDFLNLPQLQWNHAERMLRRDLAGGHQAIRDRVPPAYREAVDHAAFFLQFYRDCLDRHEERYAEMGDVGQEAILHRAPQAAFRSLKAPWRDISVRAAEAITPHLHDPRVINATRQYTETHITSLVYDTPFVQRAYSKPLGYAGDYQTMLHIYRNGFEGPSIFTRVFHKLCCEHPLSEGVRSRKQYVVQVQEQEYDRFISVSTPNQVFRVTSLGSGPARELSDFLDSRAGWDRPIHWTLVDQEEEALSLAYQQIYPKIAQNQPGKSLRCMYMSFMQFLSDPSTAMAPEPQHLIYSTGLLDYIQERRSIALIADLYKHLAPGGLLVIANALRPNTHLWFSEFALDWSLIYRDRDDMLRLARDLPEDASREIAPDPSGAFHFLRIRRP